LQDLLGHERMDTVRIYAKQAEVDLERQQKGASPPLPKVITTYRAGR
jgi:hypothetical protein